MQRTLIWSSIRSKEDATHAIRMSGLPIFLIGLLLPLFGLLSGLGENAIWTMAFGVTLIACGLFLRKGRPNIVVPLANILLTVWLILALFGILSDFSQFQHANVAFVAMHLAQTIVPFICLALSLSGLRGWWWFRQNEGDNLDGQ